MVDQKTRCEPQTTDGTFATVQAGCLIVLNSTGTPVETIYSSQINGPWDMTTLNGDSHADLFVTNVLNGTVAAGGKVVNQGTVVRVKLAVSEKNKPFLESLTVIATGFSERTDPAALVIGPTGVGLPPKFGEGRDEDDCETKSDSNEPVLYVADSLNNRVAIITRPLTRSTPSGPWATLSSGGNLNDPLGLFVADNGHVLVVNGGNGYVTEISEHGHQIARALLDS